MNENRVLLSPESFRNIYCVGRNYRLHAAELGNEVPTSPMIFTKPTHAIFEMTGNELVLPASQGSVHYEAELVFAVGRQYEAGISCDDLFSSFTVGLDLTLRDVQDKLKAKGHPWLAAKGFRNSATLGRWHPFSGELAMQASDFGLLINNEQVQRGNARDMVFDLQRIADHVGSNFGLSTGDLIYTGTPAGVGSLSDGDLLEVWWNEESLGRSRVKLEG
ncbi:fumarylacetoacetate hydrolase family protein [Cohnella lupini]|uniref:2-keto-4-pentenoate hydratase/2-oxohepta-3-ene-1,7-dioic acid hydratase in catechol pathway n=1 Tax=Cohnella lupini TaxID=1294267 RepID=A0A3D9IV94_9BACL|nr:fumarylacetoacetate hydrolase family protein [Cohnella lupini]RED65595.1 2-keto-4-pentenoate hydratase/2-oxohepta-3-ene-1,7-dioic acid hydratase in catechol pathway [Cohnella lupini]